MPNIIGLLLKTCKRLNLVSLIKSGVEAYNALYFRQFRRRATFSNQIVRVLDEKGIQSPYLTILWLMCDAAFFASQNKPGWITCGVGVIKLTWRR